MSGFTGPPDGTPIQANSWSPDQIKFQAWLAVPPSARSPRSQKELAHQLERDPATLSDWKKLPGWAQAVYQLAREHLDIDLPAILHAQIRAAKDGSLPHAMWLFELAGVWAPRSRHDGPGDTSGQIRIAIEIVDDRPPPGALSAAG